MLTRAHLLPLDFLKFFVAKNGTNKPWTSAMSTTLLGKMLITSTTLITEDQWVAVYDPPDEHKPFWQRGYLYQNGKICKKCTDIGICIDNSTYKIRIFRRILMSNMRSIGIFDVTS